MPQSTQTQQLYSHAAEPKAVQQRRAKVGAADTMFGGALADVEFEAVPQLLDILLINIAALIAVNWVWSAFKACV